jgi:hypothetical protein
MSTDNDGGIPMEAGVSKGENSVVFLLFQYVANFFTSNGRQTKGSNQDLSLRQLKRGLRVSWA